MNLNKNRANIGSCLAMGPIVVSGIPGSIRELIISLMNLWGTQKVLCRLTLKTETQ